MKMKAGNKAYIEWVGISEVEIIKYLPDSHRYKVLQDGNWKRMIKESEVYPTRKSLLEKQLEYANRRIEYYTKEKEKLERELGLC